MARALRLQFEDALYHVCARGNRRQAIYRSDKDYSRFENLLAESLSRYQVELHGYVLMGNHFHLIARTPKPNLSRWMQWLIASYSVWFNRRHRLIGHLFQGRFKAFLVQEGGYLLELSRYLHLNPVRGRMIGAGDPANRRQRLRSHRWSSYRGYAGLAKQREFVTEGLVLEEFEAKDNRQKGKIRYRRFVEEGLLREVENPFEQVQWQVVLGSDSFVRKLKDRLRARRDGAGKEQMQMRQALYAIEPEELIRRVSNHYGIKRNKLLQERAHGSQARKVAMWLLRRQGAITLREIGILFGGISYAAVSQRIRRIDDQIARHKQLRETCQMLNV